MGRYALLLAPSANRVYADAAPRLAMAELEVFAPVLGCRLAGVAQTRLGGVPYLEFEAELGKADVAYLSNLSSIYALFEVVGDLLRPVELHPLARFDDDLITIPKYAGKTNEQFTRLLLNVTVLSSGYASRMLDGGLTVLDPMCGRGTTLNQALMYGYHGIGIERSGKDVDAYAAFLRTWLRTKRVKHHAETHPVRRDRRLVARRFEVSIGREDPQRLTVFDADTRSAREFLRADSADVIVVDAPYGVAHGSHADGTRTRNPLDLLRAAVPVWVELLRTGGALGMSWNTHVASREDAAAVLTGAGLTIVDLPDLAHRVDQAILRDVLVARK